MSMEFGFTFAEAEEPQALLEAARKSINQGTKSGLGMAALAPSPEQKAADDLLLDLGRDVAAFGKARPALQALTRELFAQQNAQVSPDVDQLFATHRLYWLRIPYVLQAKADHRFERVELAITFNAGAEAKDLPRIEAALPHSELTNLAEADVKFELGISESLKFASKVGTPKLLSAPAEASGEAGGNQAGSIKFVAGPFHYRVRKATIERSNLGAERVFWRITSTEKLEDPPELVTVIAVPNATKTLTISAALQAYADPQVLAMTVGRFFKFLGERLKSFFSSGAPRRDTQVWDLSDAL